MRLLYIAARAPYADDRAQELLDTLLVAASFGAQVSVLFQDDGVWQLLPGQNGAALGRKSLGAQLEALPLFEVDHIYTDAVSLAERGLAGNDQSSKDLLLPAQALDAPALAALLAGHDQVIRL